MAANIATKMGPLEQRAAEIESAVHRVSTRFEEVPVVETSILRLMSLLGREISALLEDSLRPHGLNETDFRTLMMLFSQPNGVAHPGELCTAVALSPANMTRVADSLFERNLITRVGSDEDRRRTILHITPAGEQLVRELLPETTSRTREVFADLPQPTRNALLEQLRTLIIKIDQCALARPG